MIEEQLEPYVQKEYGLSVYEFMKQKVETESLYQYEIADLLNLDVKKVGQLSRHFGLRKKNGFKRRFNLKYGAGSVEVFKSMIEDSKNSLSDVGKHFGFTREYARQVYEKLYGHPYTKTYERKRAEKRIYRIAMKRKAKMSYMRDVVEKMIFLGIDAHIIKEDYLYRIVSSCFRLDIRVCKKPSDLGDKKCFRIAYEEAYISDCDFIVFICESEEKRIHFIIPKKYIPKSGICLFPEDGRRVSKYSKFKEAWGLLNCEKMKKFKIGLN
jgi:hypothetical protein